MDINGTIKALSALAQESRLEAFRLLVRNGDAGLPAGAIARTLDIPHNTLSSHLSILSNAGLVTSTRESRSIIYSVDFEQTRLLLSFLMEDCCLATHELCAPALDSLLPECCAATNTTGEIHEKTAR